MAKIMNFMEAWRMFSEVWSLYKKYALRKLTEAELEKVAEDSKTIYEKYRNQFTKDIVIAVINEIDRTILKSIVFEE